MMQSLDKVPQQPIQQDIQKKKKIEKQVTNIINEMIDQVQFVLSSGPHHDYFLAEEAKRLKIKEINSKYNNSIQIKLLSQIEEGKIKVSKNKTSYKLQPKVQDNPQHIIQLTKKEIMMKKKHAFEALSEILKEENELIRQQRSILTESRSMARKLHIEENPQWKSQLGLAIKRKRQLDKSFEIKDRQVEQAIKSIKDDQIKARKQKIERQRSMNMKILQEKRERQSILKIKLNESVKNCSEFVLKTKPKKYQFQIMSEREEEKIKALETQREKKIKQYKEMRQRRDWSQLKNHQQKYFQTLSERKQQWRRKFQTSLSRANKRHQQSIFFQRLKQAQSERQQAERQRENRKKEVLQRIREYGASVLQNHMPRSFVKSSRQQDIKKSTRQSLNRQQERQKGLLYLQDAKKQSRLASRSKDVSTPAAASLPIIKLPVYKDYLKQQPKRSRQNSFQTILSERKGQWASNAKSLLQRSQFNHFKNDKGLLQSAFKKIELLEAII